MKTSTDNYNNNGKRNHERENYNDNRVGSN